jgi:selenocysteine lyase/cysteine desulfurase
VIAMTGLIPKDAFIGIGNVVHLAAGGEAPPLREHLAAAAQFLGDKAAGMPGRERMYATAERVRGRLAALLGVEAADVAFLSSASDGLSVAAAGIDWRPGDNAVVALSEYPSVLHAWRGSGAVEVRAVGRAAVPHLEEIAGAVDRRTRVIAASHVSYLTGARVELAALREIADRVGARLVVDASHALGVVPVDGRLCDVLVSCAYKWLLGVHGVGVFYANSARWPDLAPPGIGWHSIEPEEDWRRRTAYRIKSSGERFELGNYSFVSLYLLERGLGALERAGAAAIADHVLRLGGVLRDGLDTLGLPVLTPADPMARAGSIAFAADRSEQLEAALRASGVIAWGGHRRLRLSVHAYNDEADVARALQALGNT